MKIEYYRKDVYGSPLFYVANADLAHKLTALLHTKTINEAQMERITDIFGVEFVQIINPN